MSNEKKKGVVATTTNERTINMQFTVYLYGNF